MDQNVSGMIAANVALIQPWYSPYLSVLGGALSALIGAAAVYYTTKRAQKQEILRFKNADQFEKRKIKYAEYQRRQQSYSELRGNQRARMQIYAAYFSAQINANYHDLYAIVNAISRIDYNRGMTVSEINVIFMHERTNSIFYKEQQIERAKLADLMLLSAEKSSYFFSTLSLIKVLFPNTKELRDLIKQVEMFLGLFSFLAIEFDRKYEKKVASITNSEINSNVTRDEYVGKWTSEIISDKNKDVKRYIKIYHIINLKINKLSKYLEDEIEKETLEDWGTNK